MNKKNLIIGPAKLIEVSPEGNFKDCITRRCWLELTSCAKAVERNKKPPNTLWQCVAFYAYTEERINLEADQNKGLYYSASGMHIEFTLGEAVYVCLNRQSFGKNKSKRLG